jgi:hypothetical protein
MRAENETVESEEASVQEFASAQIEEAWNLGANSMLLTIEDESAFPEESVKVVQSKGSAGRISL